MSCSVVGGSFAVVVQICLAVITCMVLVWKKVYETGARTWFDFGLDSSKQLAGAGWVHIANMLCAVLLATDLPGVDGCSWYAANVIIDTTLGVFVEILLLRSIQHLAKIHCSREIADALESGVYWKNTVLGREFQMANYFIQLFLWLLIVTVMKIAMVATMQIMPWVVYAINFLLIGFADRPQGKLFVVMICVPMVMNTFQFVVTDNFIKMRPGLASQRAVEVEHRLEDEEEEEECHRRVHSVSCLGCTGPIVSNQCSGRSPKSPSAPYRHWKS